MAEKRDLIAELCDAVREAGGVMRLYGKPVTDDELRWHAEGLVDAKLDRALELAQWQEVWAADFIKQRDAK
jgi:hypothetical protein